MDSPCIEWMKGRDKDGYGKTSVGGKHVRAHRLAYCVSNGVPLESIKGLQIRHKCDNPSCVNPEHLEAGTNADNMRDKVERGRQAKGESMGLSKLTELHVKQILAEFVPRSAEFGARPLSRKFNVCHKTILNIVKGRTWSPT